jgi:hypothetical protein
VSGEVALRHIFEAWDGGGIPDRLTGGSVPETVFAVSLAGDLEIFSRVYGLCARLARLRGFAGGEGGKGLKDGPFLSKVCTTAAKLG